MTKENGTLSNECQVLKYLIENARVSDSFIAEHIGITTQAVGKIRRKLEANEVILGYQPLLSHPKIGLELFTHAELIVPPDMLNDRSFRKAIQDDPHMMSCTRLLYGETDLLCTFGFRNLEESQAYFLTFLESYPGIRIGKLQNSRSDLVWKLNRKQAFTHAVEQCGKEKQA